ncbi:MULTISPECIES: helix-turn-helix transcriptional regulator [Thermodesulfovibrio]|jgi:excisionase family DNA binding protein|uniref:helix-turn-helix transcriptional regulator n=1 Tax=Thermodesulfovibrio TaxID=28261 RepID=UPI00262B8AE0|nr:helix-turn-helix domain-containing protein [Thermodesulfovibrio sp.]
MQRLLTIREACSLLKVSQKTLYRYLKDGKLPFVKLSNRAVRIKEVDIMNLITENTIIYEPTERTEEVAKKVLEKILSRG